MANKKAKRPKKATRRANPNTRTAEDDRKYFEHLKATQHVQSAVLVEFRDENKELIRIHIKQLRSLLHESDALIHALRLLQQYRESAIEQNELLLKHRDETQRSPSGKYVWDSYDGWKSASDSERPHP